MAGVLPENIAHFARALRRAGLPVGPSSVVEAVKAVEVGGLGSRDDLYWTLHANFVKRRDHSAVFHEAFHLFFRKRDLIEKMLQILSPVTKGVEKDKEKPKAGATRVSDAFFNQPDEKHDDDIVPEIEVDARFTMSQKDIVRTKDFAQMTVDELSEAKRQIAGLQLPVDNIKTRRFARSHHTIKLDMSATLRTSMGSGGDLLLPQFVAPKHVPPPIVALCDISGSMSQYSRIFLHFLHALAEKNRRVHTFLFGTRLTNVTRQLKMKDPDEALDGVSDAVLDWSGGTRIASTLRSFNRDWSRRVLGQGAIVLMITDGLERDGVDELSHEMDRLHRSCRHLLWLNPLLRYDRFEARAQGIRAMLNHVDDFRAIHSIDAMADLCSALSEPRMTRHDPKAWLAA
ncbi:MAG: VWA domain-containing protein [Hyphomicrobiales bacterium]